MAVILAALSLFIFGCWCVADAVRGAIQTVLADNDASGYVGARLIEQLDARSPATKDLR